MTELFQKYIPAWVIEQGYVGQVFFVVFVTMLANFMQKRALVRLETKLQKTKMHWDEALVYGVQKPISLIIWVVGLSFAAEIVRKATGAPIFDAVHTIRDAVVIASIGWAIIRFISFTEKSILEEDSSRDRATVEAVSKLLRISVIITATLVGLQTLGYSVSGVLAFGGIGGVAIGFAGKDLLANFFGGLVIYLDRPFATGDWIRSPDRDIEGTVEKIGWRITRIRTFDKRPLYVPNAAFTTISVENPSRMLNRRIFETVGIRYQDAGKMEAITGKVREMLRQHPEIETNNTLIVNFNKFAPSSLDFFVYAFTKTRDWVEYHTIKEELMLKILAIVEEEGAEVAFPTSTLHLGDQEILKSLQQNN
ncbi:MAG: mechanosensitive ion channel family protein [Candidatus Nitrohelix vancouverensis]|uniref:Mechanosensitive ion channel family protein n=1 Tax=Candidatus Nitrohelix vancouverensis TaxID=2705534 RepID=A0A7T0C195_9BACT|nr:MAG: mechanosensitive ion channel family protein [Candidatus Nitrohelix vancouverensis]